MTIHVKEVRDNIGEDKSGRSGRGEGMHTKAEQ